MKMVDLQQTLRAIKMASHSLLPILRDMGLENKRGNSDSIII